MPLTPHYPLTGTALSPPFAPGPGASPGAGELALSVHTSSTLTLGAHSSSTAPGLYPPFAPGPPAAPGPPGFALAVHSALVGGGGTEIYPGSDTYPDVTLYPGGGAPSTFTLTPRTPLPL